MSAKAKVSSVAFLMLLLLGGGACYWWIHDEPRRSSLANLAELQTALQSGDRAQLRSMVAVPEGVRLRTGPEQSEFLAKALSDEISFEGLSVLKRRGTYGPLKEVFPEEADTWAKQAGVSAEDCVAFRMERNGLRAEVVLVRPANSEIRHSSREPRYRIVRLNNVRQMAAQL